MSFDYRLSELERWLLQGRRVAATDGSEAESRLPVLRESEADVMSLDAFGNPDAFGHGTASGARLGPTPPTVIVAPTMAHYNLACYWGTKGPIAYAAGFTDVYAYRISAGNQLVPHAANPGTKHTGIFHAIGGYKYYIGFTMHFFSTTIHTCSVVPYQYMPYGTIFDQGWTSGNHGTMSGYEWPVYGSAVTEGTQQPMSTSDLTVTVSGTPTTTGYTFDFSSTSATSWAFQNNSAIVTLTKVD